MGYAAEVRHYARQVFELSQEGPADYRWVSRLLPHLRALANYLGYELVPYGSYPAPSKSPGDEKSK